MVDLGAQNSNWRAGVVVDFVDNFSGPVMNLIKNMSAKASASFRINPTISEPISKLNIEATIDIDTKRVASSMQNLINKYKGDVINIDASKLESEINSIIKSFEYLDANKKKAKVLFKEDRDAASAYLDTLDEIVALKNEIGSAINLYDSDLADSVVRLLEGNMKGVYDAQQELKNSLGNSAGDAIINKRSFADIDKFVDGMSSVAGSYENLMTFVSRDDQNNISVDEKGFESVVKELATLDSIMPVITKFARNTDALTDSIISLGDEGDVLLGYRKKMEALVPFLESLRDMDISHLDKDEQKKFNDLVDKMAYRVEDAHEKIQESIADSQLAQYKSTNAFGKFFIRRTRTLREWEQDVKRISGNIEKSALNQFLQRPAVQKISLVGAGFMGGSMLLSATNEENLQAYRETQLLNTGTIKPMDASYAASRTQEVAIKYNIHHDNFDEMTSTMGRYADTLKNSEALKGTMYEDKSATEFSAMIARVAGMSNISAETAQQVATGIKRYGAISAETVKTWGDNDDLFRRAAIAIHEGKEIHEIDQAYVDTVYPDGLAIPLNMSELETIDDMVKKAREAELDHFSNQAKIMGKSFQTLGSTVTEFSYNYGGLGPIMKGVNKIIGSSNSAIHAFAESQSGITKYIVGFGLTATSSLFAVGKAFPAIAETAAHTALVFNALPTGVKDSIKNGIGKIGPAALSGAKAISKYSGITKAASGITNLFTAATGGAAIAQKVHNKSMFGSVKAIVANTAAKIGNIVVTVALAVASWAAAVPMWVLAAAALAVVVGLIALVAIGYLVYKNWDKITAAFKTAWEWVKNLGAKFVDFGKNLIQTMKPVQWLSNAFKWLMSILGLTGKEGEGFMAKIFRIGKILFYISNPIGWIIGAFKLITGLFDKMAGSSNPVISTIGKLGKIFMYLFTPIGWVMLALDRLIKHKDAIIGFFKGIGSGISSFFTNIGSNAKESVSGMVSDVKAVGKFYINAFRDPRKAATQIWASIKDNKAIGSVRSSINSVWDMFNDTKIVGDVKNKTSQIWAALEGNNFTGPLVKSINKSFESLRDGFKEDGVYGAFSSFINYQKSSLNQMWGSFKDRSIFRFIGNLFNLSNSFFTNIGSNAKGIGSLISNVFKDPVSSAQQMWGTFRDTRAGKFVEELGRSYAGVFSKSKRGVTELWARFKDSSVFNFLAMFGLRLIKFFRKLLSPIQKLIDKIADYLISAFRNIYVSITGALINIFTFLTSKIVAMFNKLSGYLSGPFNTIKDLVISVVQFLGNALANILNVFIKNINKAIQVANKVPGVNIDLLPTVDMTEGLPKFKAEIEPPAEDAKLFGKIGDFFEGIGSTLMSGIDDVYYSLPSSNSAPGSAIIKPETPLMSPDFIRGSTMAMNDFSDHRMQNEGININSNATVQGAVDVNVNLGNLPKGSVTEVTSRGQVNTPKLRSGSLSGAQKRKLGNSGGSNS